MYRRASVVLAIYTYVYSYWWKNVVMETALFTTDEARMHFIRRNNNCTFSEKEVGEINEYKI